MKNISTQHERFNLKSKADLDTLSARLGITLPWSDDLSPLSRPLATKAFSLDNRFAVLPMEGHDSLPDGAPGELSFRRYRRFAEGGSALIWAEACAVTPEARTSPEQFWLHDGSADAFARMVEETKRAGMKATGREPVMILQLTHSGRNSKPRGKPEPLIAVRNPILDPIHQLGPEYPIVTDERLDRLQDEFTAAARLAERAGFDGVDVKCCHRYLLSELLGAVTRPGRYGGSYENRTRMVRETFGKVRSAVSRAFVTTRMNVYDAFPHPQAWGVAREEWRIPDLTEPLMLISQLRDMGLSLLSISIGNPYFNPQFNRPYDNPIRGFNPPDEHPAVGMARILHITRRIQEANADLPVIGFGLSWLRQFFPNVAAGAVRDGGMALCGQGRSAFAYPDAPLDIARAGALDPKKTCITCSLCTQLMRDARNAGCAIRDRETYSLKTPETSS